MVWAMVSEIDADVVPEDVFRLYADPETWGDWAHNTRWGRARGEFRPGGHVDVRVANYPYTYDVVVREIVDGRRVVCQVNPVGVNIVSTYDVAPHGTGARLRHTIEISGPLERLYRLLEGTYTKMLQEETRKVASLSVPAARA